jgi:hypothetical protein
VTPEDVPDEILAPLLEAGEQEGTARTSLARALDWWSKAWSARLHARADDELRTHNPECECERIPTLRYIADELEGAEVQWWRRLQSSVRPRTDDAVDRWLHAHRDADDDPAWQSMLNDLIDDYRAHARTNRALDEEASDG